MYSYVTCRLVIDTSFLYMREGAPSASPGLKELSRYVLGLELPLIHDSIRDACVAMQLADFVQKNGFQPPVPRILDDRRVSGGGNRGSAVMGVEKEKALLVHRIPDRFIEKDIFNLIVAQTNIVPLQVTPIVRPGPMPNTGKAYLHFTTVGHCDLSFDSLAGSSRPEKGNLPQKRVYINGGSYICIRKYKA